MASFNGSDYDELFRLGQELWHNDILQSRRREIAVQLMAMAESVRGQQWPSINARYRHLTRWPLLQCTKLRS